MKKLIAILLIGLFLRFYPLTLTDRIIGADGYYHLGTSKQIIEKGDIPEKDLYSFSGRKHIYAPGFHVLASSFSLISGISLEKVGLLTGPIFYIFSACLSFLYSPLTSFFLTTLPVYVWRTTINFLPTALWLYLVFLLIKYRTKKPALLFSLTLALTHSMALLVLPILYIVNKNKKIRTLFILFTLIASYFWIDVESIHQNVPEGLRAQIFEGLSLKNFSGERGYIARGGPQLLLSFFGIEGLFPVMWFAVFFTFMAASLIEFDRALVASSLLIARQAGRATEKANLVFQYILIIFSIFWAFHMLSALSWGYIPEDNLSALFWLRHNSAGESVVASTLGEGYWIAGISERKNIMDGHFAGIEDVEERFEGLSEIFSEKKIEAIQKYDVSFIYATLNAKYQYGFTGLPRKALVYEKGGANVYKT